MSWQSRERALGRRRCCGPARDLIELCSADELRLPNRLNKTNQYEMRSESAQENRGSPRSMKLSTCTYGRRENKEKLMNKLDRPEKKLALELPVKRSIEVARRSAGVGKQSSACELCNRPAVSRSSKCFQSPFKSTPIHTKLEPHSLSRLLGIHSFTPHVDRGLSELWRMNRGRARGASVCGSGRGRLGSGEANGNNGE